MMRSPRWCGAFCMIERDFSIACMLSSPSILHMDCHGSRHEDDNCGVGWALKEAVVVSLDFVM